MNFNSTETYEENYGFEESQSGEQEGVVDSPESQYDDFDIGGDGHGSAVGSYSEDGDEEDDLDGGEAGDDSDGAGQSEGRKTQTREDNAAIRAARLRAERQAAERVQREANERIARSKVVNPYTGKPFQSVEELEQYGAQVQEAEIRREAKRTGRSVEELREERENRDLLSQLRSERQAKAEADRAQAAQREFAQKDLAGFVKKHPDVDVGRLVNNQQFLRFAGSRFGKEPMADLYDDYKAIVGAAESVGSARARGAASRSTGSGGGGGELLTAAQRKSLAEWNAQNPDMKMTAKEFLGK